MRIGTSRYGSIHVQAFKLTCGGYSAKEITPKIPKWLLQRKQVKNHAEPDYRRP
jgi:hypothetical protein